MKLLRLVVLVVLLTTMCLAQGPAYPYNVTSTCTPPAGSGLTFNMYRAPFTTACGAFAKQNTTALATCSYTDVNPPEGTYCYEATALDKNGESGPSNVAQAQVPPPPPTNLGVTVAKNSVSGHDIVAKWTNPTSKLTASDFYMGTQTKVYTTHLHLLPPIHQVRWFQIPPGTYFASVTDTSANGQSDYSAEVKFTVPVQ